MLKDIRFAKFVLAINGLVPGALLLWDAYHGHAGANPVNYAIRTTGLLALIFLPLSLLVTPLRKLTGLNWLFHFRRLLGLYAFFYALAHFSIFFGFDRALNVQSTLSEMVKRPYLVVGSLGLLAMVPLAATSANFMIKRLGPDRWRALHRLAYVAVVAGVVHFYMLVKSDIRLPVAFGIIVAALLGYRLLAFIVRRLKTPAVLLSTSRAETLPESPRWIGRLRVEQIIQETADVRTFRLVSPDGAALPFAYLPGQYLTFTLAIAGKNVRRSYTIASTPTRANHCEVTIKRDGRGLGSRHIHDTVKEGDLLSISAPAGRFTFTGDDAKAVTLIAAGVGITPLMSMLRYLTDQRWTGRIHLIYCNKTADDIIFREEIETLCKQHPNVNLTLTLTRASGASGWNGTVGRIDAQLLTRVIPDLTSTPIYLCGPQEMLTATRNILRKLGVAETNIHTESFGGTPSPATNSSDSKEFAVTFSRSNKTATLNAGRPILSLAEELGIGVDSECRSGICGRCKCKLISGTVEMETQDALDRTDRRERIILLCQARPLEAVTVEA